MKCAMRIGTYVFEFWEYNKQYLDIIGGFSLLLHTICMYLHSTYIQMIFLQPVVALLKDPLVPSKLLDTPTATLTVSHAYGQLGTCWSMSTSGPKL